MGKHAPKTRGAPTGRRITEWIEAVPERCGGQPTIRGTRITVPGAMWMMHGKLDLKKVAEYHRLPVEAFEEVRRVWLSGEYPREWWDEDQSGGNDDA